MTDKPIHTEALRGGFTLEILHDLDCESPRQWDNLAVFAAKPWKSNFESWAREVWGSDYIHDFSFELLSEWGEAAAEKNLRRAWRDGHYAFEWNKEEKKMRTIYVRGAERLFGVTLKSVGSGRDREAFFAFVPESRLDKECPGLTDQEKEAKAAEIIALELEIFRQWADGECYGFRIRARNGKVLDSCFGFIGFGDCVEYAKGEAKHLAKNYCPPEGYGVCAGV